MRLQQGFTIVELMIATSIFSIILMMGLAGFVQVGKTYYKGVTVAQTQEAASQAFNQITADIRLSSPVSSIGSTSNGSNYYCIGSHRFTFRINNMIDTANHDFTNNFGLVEDELSGSSACGNPFDSPAVPFKNPTELLGNQMRVLAFNLAPVANNGNLFDVDLTVAFGQDSVLTTPISPSSQCKLQLGGTQFCAITQLSTVVFEGV